MAVNFSKESVQDAAKQSGMSINEYLDALPSSYYQDAAKQSGMSTDEYLSELKNAWGESTTIAEPVKKKEQPIPSKALPGLGSPMEEGGTESISPSTSLGYTAPSSQQPAQRTEFVTKATFEEGYKAPAVESFAKQMKQEGISQEAPKDDFFNESIQLVNKDLIGKSPDEVANTLKYHFGDYGFDFYPTGESGQVVAKSKDGKEIQIPADALFDFQNQDMADKMKDFLRQNRAESERLKTIESGAIQKEKKIINQDEVKQKVKSIDDETQSFNQDVKLYLQAKALYDNQKNKYLNVTPEQLSSDPQLKADYDQFVANRKRLSEIGGNIAQQEKDLKDRSIALQSAVGKYTASKASTGTWGGALWNSMVKGVSGIIGGGVGILEDIYTTNKPLDVNSKEYQDSFIKAAKQKGIEIPAGQDFDTFYKNNFKNIGDIESQMRDNMKKEAKYGAEGKVGDAEKIKNTLKDYLSVEGTTPEYINKLEENILGRGILGVAEFAPAMAAAAYSGNAGFLTAALTAHDNIMEQMNTPAFKDVSEDDKNKFAAPYAIVNGLLMGGGFAKAAAQEGVVNGLIARALSKLTKGSGAKTFSDFVARDIENFAAKRILTVAGGFTSGFETGVELAAFDMAMKDVYNDFKGKEMFNTPKDWEEYAKVLGESGLVMGIGGGILSIPKAMNVYHLSPIQEEFKGPLLDNGTFEIFEQTAKDPEYQNMIKVDYQNKINQGIITFEQAKKEFDNYVQLKGLLQTVDPALTTEQRKEALAILQERQQLEKDIAGKDPNLGTIKAKQDRIAKLNTMLSNIATPSYTIEGKSLDKQEFVDRINSMSKDELSKLNANVKNDQEVQKILETKLQENAIQEPSTETGVLRTEQPEVGLPKVGEGDTEEQAVAEEGGQVLAPKESEVTEPLKDVESTTKALENVDDKQIGVIDYNAKRLSLEEREKEDKPIIKDNTPIGTFAKNEMGDAYQLQSIKLKDLTPRETKQDLDLVEKYINWKKEGNEFPPITALRNKNGELFIVDGHNRYRAAKLNGDENIKVWVGLNKGNQPLNINEAISEAYHKAKADGSNPELVKAVEEAIGKPAEAPAAKEGEVTAEPLKDVESTTKALENVAEKNPEPVANAASKVFEDAGYHRGSLGKKSDYINVSYVGDMPFTGYYFISKPELAVQGGSRFGDPKAFRIVDFSKYNLFKPEDANVYWGTKSALKKLAKEINRGENIEESLNTLLKNHNVSNRLKNAIKNFTENKEQQDYLKQQISKLDRLLITVKSNREFDALNKEIESLNNELKNIKKNPFSEELSKILEQYQKNRKTEEFSERLETMILKSLGYEGVDVRGMKDYQGSASPDSFSEGSVIFDLNPNTTTTLSEAYHKAKADGSNPELVKAVEEAIGKPAEAPAPKNSEVMTPELEKEVADLEAILGPPAGEARFRLAEGEEEPISESDVEKITKEMNKMAPVELNFTEPVDKRSEIIVSPASESNALEKLSPEEAVKITKDIQDFNGIPMTTGMSDILATGTVKDSQGNDLKVNGGILFNVLDPANKKLAWAGIDEQGAKEQYDNAVSLYNANKPLFDRLWKEGKLPYGQVPMAIMRMSDTAVNSNEAVFRWILPTIESLPEENRKNALDAFVESMNKKLNTLDANKAKDVLDFIKEKNITTLDGLTKAVIEDANLRTKGSPESKLALDDRGFIYDAIFAPSGIKKASKPTVKALLEGTGDKYNDLFLSDNIYKAIGEPSMLKTGQGDVVSIVGIDVLNGGVTQATHGNYGFGPKGGIIALIRNPKNGIDVFPEWKAKASRVYKPNVRGEYPTPEAVSQQTGGAFFLDKAFRGAKPTVGEMTDLDVLIGKLRFAFPSVQVAKTPEEFNGIINREDVRKRIASGKTILGVTVDGKIYLNPEYNSLNTPIHEFGHIWIDFLRSDASGEKGTKLLEKGFELIKGTKAHKRAIKKYGDTQLALEEALVEELGSKGNNIYNAAKRSKFKSWMNAMFKYIQEKFTTFKNLNVKDIANLKLKDFINIGLADLFSGKEVSGKFRPEATEEAARARFEAIEKIDDIVKVARENKFSDEAIKKVLERRGFGAEEINTALKESFKAIEGYDRLQNEIVNVVSKSEQRGVTPERTMQNVIDYVQKSAVYERANDIQREQIIREIRSQFGLKEKAAPSFNKILGAVKDVTKVTMTEKTALKKQIKDLARGARDAKQAWSKINVELAKELNELAKGNKLSVKQVKSITNKLSKLNVFNEEAVSRFVGYMDKVFQDAEYSDKLSTANGLRKTIKKISKNKDKDVNLTKLGKDFSAIDPSLVDDIDAYNAMGEKIKESIKGSTLKPRGVKLADMVNVEDAMLYVNEAMNKQREELTKIKAEEIKNILNVDVSDLSYDDMLQMIDSKEPITKDNEKIIRDTIKKYFDGYSSIAEKMIVSGEDVFTGEEVEFTSKQKELIKKFMDMDLNQLSPKDALGAVDALNNFTQNHSTAKMASTVAKYTGAKNAKDLADRNIKATPLTTYMRKDLGRTFGEQLTTLPVLIETMFAGYNKGALVRKEMGLTELVNKKAQAEHKANKIVEDYVDKFYDRKANGEIFNSEDNMTERGIIAFTTRNVIGTPEEIQNEFNRRKGLIEQSIDVLRDGSESEQKKAELYQKAYDKLLSKSNNANEVREKADTNNVEAVDWWVEKWADEYDDLSDISQSIYNKILDKDSGYTTDRYTKLEGVEKEKEELTNEQSAFYRNNNATYKKSSGVLMEATKPEMLPKNKSGEPLMYVDLSFDNINSNALYDALMDMNTAAPIRQVEAFYESKDFKKLIPSLEDREMLKNRIKSYIRDSRDKNIVETNELNNILRKLNKITTIGVGQALGGIGQSVKQVIPVATNTFINAGKLSISNLYNKDVMSFIDNSGRAIANRGSLSQVQIEALNRLIDKVDKSKGEKLVDAVEKLQSWWLETFLVRPDIFIARASWLTYYEKYLKDKGIVDDSSKIDYSTHKLNEDAADYAQDMVDRQQNISDHDLAGQFLTTKDPFKGVARQVGMPFASFRMNQIMRMHSDWSILKNPTATSEDKKIAARSLGGAAGEMLMFKVIQLGLGIGITSLMLSLMGEDEKEADFKKRLSNSFKGQMTGAVTDVLSPLPLTDRPIQFVTNLAIDKAQQAAGVSEKDRINIFDGSQSDVFQTLGTFGITGKRAYDIYNIGKLAATGKFKDDYGNERFITKDQQDKLKAITALSMVGNSGVLPNEVNSAINGYVKFIKKNAKTKKQLEKEVLMHGYKSIKEMKADEEGRQIYEETFGKGSDYYEKKQEEKERKAELSLEEPTPKSKKSEKSIFGSRKFGE